MKEEKIAIREKSIFSSYDLSNFFLFPYGSCSTRSIAKILSKTLTSAQMKTSRLGLVVVDEGEKNTPSTTTFDKLVLPPELPSIEEELKTFKQLTLAFGSWAGKKWVPSWKQMDALARQARRLKIPTEDYRTRQQQVRALFGKTTQQTVIQKREFSRNYRDFHQWQSETTRTTACQRRVINYLKIHPNASLAEARGHKTKRS